MSIAKITVPYLGKVAAQSPAQNVERVFGTYTVCAKVADIGSTGVASRGL